MDTINTEPKTLPNNAPNNAPNTEHKTLPNNAPNTEHKTLPNTSQKDIRINTTYFKEQLHMMYKYKGKINKNFGATMFTAVAIMLLFMFLTHSYFDKIIITMRNTWHNNKYNPFYILLSGFIKPDQINDKDKSNMSIILKYFNNLVETIITTTVSGMLKPAVNVLKSNNKGVGGLHNILGSIAESINGITSFASGMFSSMYAIVSNMIAPIQVVISHFDNMMQTLLGVVITNLYMMFGVNMMMQSFFKILYKFVLTLLIGISVAFFVFLAIALSGPWGAWAWGGVTILTVIYILFAVPAGILVKHLPDVAGIKGRKISAKPSKSMGCFSSNTTIKLYNGEFKPISKIEIGDKLSDGGLVTCLFIFTTAHQKLIKLHNSETQDDFLVTSLHPVMYAGDWIYCGEHPRAIPVSTDSAPSRVYCLSTSTKQIHIGNYVFTDWDEIDNEDIATLKHKMPKHVTREGNMDFSVLNEQFDGGFIESTQVETAHGAKSIRNIKIDDILANNSVVLGIAKIKPPHKCVTTYINGKPHMTGNNNNVFYSSYSKPATITNSHTNTHTNTTTDTLYHILTSTGDFFINKVRIAHYNSCFETILAN